MLKSSRSVTNSKRYSFEHKCSIVSQKPPFLDLLHGLISDGIPLEDEAKQNIMRGPIRVKYPVFEEEDTDK